ncbi:hypothetical protein A6R68_23445 [Neotoma lepida]|uniref:Uncharacterized protein n=1 Tax=Neotoma lepida TaxID=56216 RepID=A0A1A6HVS7_NEOLE|nr:hypothetical protein A6R68_23445 [Neotoma lepida]
MAKRAQPKCLMTDSSTWAAEGNVGTNSPPPSGAPQAQEKRDLPQPWTSRAAAGQYPGLTGPTKAATVFLTDSGLQQLCSYMAAWNEDDLWSNRNASFHFLSEKHSSVPFLEVDVDDCQDIAANSEVKCMLTFQSPKQALGHEEGGVQHQLSAYRQRQEGVHTLGQEEKLGDGKVFAKEVAASEVSEDCSWQIGPSKPSRQGESMEGQKLSQRLGNLHKLLHPPRYNSPERGLKPVKGPFPKW